jgi:pyruvate/2-oxoglutarate/acetoin dehydrogenase E1 component
MQSVLDALNNALHQAMSADSRVFLLGEDVLDPYGGAFKVTRGLSSAFPERVLTTPISEAGITGVAAGMALRGLRPVVEIMFGDFVTLIADQLINHIAKFRWMYNDQVNLPLVIRTPMGGRRGYGPTHSQTLEKLFLGTPGLTVLAPNSLNDPTRLLAYSILTSQDPILFIENKLLYLQQVQDPTLLADFELSSLPATGIPDGPETFTLSLRGAPPPVLTLSAYGYMAELSRRAALRLAYEYEIFVELVVPEQLSPFVIDPLLTSLQKTGRLLTIEEGSLTMGWGAELLARCTEELGPRLHLARRLGAQDLPVPASASLEEAVLPGVDDIVHQARAMVMINRYTKLDDELV